MLMCSRRDAGLLHHIASAAAQRDGRRAAAVVADLDVAPTDPATPAGAERFEHRFLRRPAAGVVLRGRLLAEQYAISWSVYTRRDETARRAARSSGRSAGTR